MLMSVEEFDDMTLKTFFNKLDGFTEMRNQTEQAAWVRTRWSTAMLMNVHTKATIKPENLIRFPWEKNKVVKVISKSDILNDLKTLNKNRLRKKLLNE